MIVSEISSDMHQVSHPGRSYEYHARIYILREMIFSDHPL